MIERRKPPRMVLSSTQQDALQAARASGGLWYWRGGFWLNAKPPSSQPAPTPVQLEGGWFTTGTIIALEARELLMVNWGCGRWNSHAIPVDHGVDAGRRKGDTGPVK